MNSLIRLYPGHQAVVVVATTLVVAKVVILAAFLLSRIAARHNAAARSTLWLCALGCVLLGPLVTFGFQRPGVSIVRVPSYTRSTTAASPVPSGNFAPPLTPPDSTPVEGGPREFELPPADRSAEAEGLSAVVNRSVSQTGGELWRATAGAVIGIWVLGLFTHMARFLFGYRSLLILRSDVQPIDERRLNSLSRSWEGIMPPGFSSSGAGPSSCVLEETRRRRS